MKILVQKFGGTSLASVDRIAQAASIVRNALKEGKHIVVVASAMGRSTDDLLALSAPFSKKGAERELDLLLATGEQVSASLLALALNSLGVPAQAFTGEQAGIFTDNLHGSASIKKIKPDRLIAALGQGKVAVVTGFQGLSNLKEITTLGRGGSDTTAVALAGALQAERCDIYTDVDGVYSVDPRLYDKPVKLLKISFAQMLAFADAGAQVMSLSSMEIGEKYGIPVIVRSVFDCDTPGTVIGGDTFSLPICGVACEANHDLFAVEPVDSISDITRLNQLIDDLRDKGVKADVVRRVGQSHTTRVYVTLGGSHVFDLKVLMRESALSHGLDVEHIRKMSKVSLVGKFENPDETLHWCMTSLNRADVHPRYWAVKGNMCISFILPRSMAIKAIETLHEEFFTRIAEKNTDYAVAKQ